jgi:hypothetical protein
MSYEELNAHAVEIHDLAIKKYMEERGMMEVDGKFVDPMSTGDDTLLQELMNQAQSEFADVPQMFNDFTVLPEPGDFTPLITGVESAMKKLSASENGLNDPITGALFPQNIALVDMTSAAGYLDEWDGLGAMEFMENFATPFPKRCMNQFAAACVLVNALRAEQAIWTETRANIDKIAHDAKTALDEMNDCGKNEWEMAFSVVGAVVAVGALTVASGGTAAIVLGAVGAASSVGGTVSGQIDEPPEPRFSGESSTAVVDSVRKAVNDLKTYVSDAETKVQQALSNANGTVSGSPDEYVAPKPSFLDQDKPDIGRPDSD